MGEKSIFFLVLSVEHLFIYQFIYLRLIYLSILKHHYEFFMTKTAFVSLDFFFFYADNNDVSHGQQELVRTSLHQLFFFFLSLFLFIRYSFIRLFFLSFRFIHSFIHFLSFFLAFFRNGSVICIPVSSVVKMNPYLNLFLSNDP